METMTRRSWITTASLSIVAAGIAADVTRRVSPSAPIEAHATSARQLLQQRHLPNVPLVAHDGTPVRFYDDLAKDKKIVVNFFDHSRADFETVVGNLAATHRLLGNRVGRDIHMYSVTLNPETDTPATLRTYAGQIGDRPGWTLLTGDPSHVETLRHAIGFAYPDRAEDSDRSNITSILRYGNEPEMRWAHATTLGNPEMIAHMIVADFGPDPADPSARFSFYCKLLSPTPKP